MAEHPVAEYIARVKRRYGLNGDQAVADMLGVAHSTVAAWRRGDCLPARANFDRVAELAGIEAAAAGADYEAWDRARANAVQPPDAQKARRRCLRCGKTFLSAWVGNRMCRLCKGHANQTSEGVA